MFLGCCGLLCNYLRPCKENPDSMEIMIILRKRSSFLIIKRIYSLVSILSENVIWGEGDLQSFKVILWTFPLERQNWTDQMLSLGPWGRHWACGHRRKYSWLSFRRSQRLRPPPWPHWLCQPDWRWITS